MNLSRFFDRKNAATSEPMFSVAHLTQLLRQHGFDYLGFSSDSDVAHGMESHSFSNGDVTFLFGFAYSIYGEDLIAISDTANPKSLIYLSYYVDYADPRNKFREAGFSHDEALAMALKDQVDNAVALYRYVRSQGRTVPLRSDRLHVLGREP